MYSASELELIGAIIGDGHIHIKHSKYYFGLTGNKITDKEYYSKLTKMIEEVWGKKTKVFESGRGLRIRIYSKMIVQRLTNIFSIPFNKGKCFRVKIPGEFLNDFDNGKHMLRGIMDTDGSVFTSNKPGSPNYPSMEITTSSFVLANQIRALLVRQNYRVANVRGTSSKRKNIVYKVGIYGKKNLKKWIDEIGFSNPVKLNRANFAL